MIRFGHLESRLFRGERAHGLRMGGEQRGLQGKGAQQGIFNDKIVPLITAAEKFWTTGEYFSDNLK